ncbi:LOB domain-containing protein 31 isoform X1 [Raphanus sativus]|uniref:LOB domain-containing protein 31 isoform X1 n=1 Tax=Raphanus sativus TaxID=3726 RepID=A0A6J0LZW1_RAPSA|nr:LOB domain-containing protein 31 isoform X1 [Raphanus sativus]
MSGSTTSGGSPCGACKFLRRKCVAECVFAPYFDAEEGTAHFAAVHKVFGASNTSKLLLMIPANRRPEAVATLSYEALARLRDPVYGCVGHIFALQHQQGTLGVEVTNKLKTSSCVFPRARLSKTQVMSLQEELAVVKTHLSTLQRLPPQPKQQNNSQTEATSSTKAPLIATADHKNNNVSSSLSHIYGMSPEQQQQQQPQEDTEVQTESVDFSTLLGLEDPLDRDGDLNTLAREFVSKYLAEGKYRPSSPI